MKVEPRWQDDRPGLLCADLGNANVKPLSFPWIKLPQDRKTRWDTLPFNHLQSYARHLYFCLLSIHTPLCLGKSQAWQGFLPVPCNITWANQMHLPQFLNLKGGTDQWQPIMWRHPERTVPWPSSWLWSLPWFLLLFFFNWVNELPHTFLIKTFLIKSNITSVFVICE